MQGGEGVAPRAGVVVVGGRAGEACRGGGRKTLPCDAVGVVGKTAAAAAVLAAAAAWMHHVHHHHHHVCALLHSHYHHHHHGLGVSPPLCQSRHPSSTGPPRPHRSCRHTCATDAVRAGRYAVCGAAAVHAVWRRCGCWGCEGGRGSVRARWGCLPRASSSIGAVGWLLLLLLLLVVVCVCH